MVPRERWQPDVRRVSGGFFYEHPRMLSRRGVDPGSLSFSERAACRYIAVVREARRCP